MSCDDGQTWINDMSDNNTNYCETNDCDHNPGSAVGLDAGTDGWVYAQYGWGYNGSVRKSRDGKNWQVVRSNGWGGGLAVANNIIFSYWEVNGAISKDQGATWQPTKDLNQWDLIDHGGVFSAGQKMIIKGRLDGQLFISSDFGTTWKKSPTFKTAWGKSFVEGNGVLIAHGDGGVSSRSLDGGLTWSNQTVATGATPDDRNWQSRVIFNGTHFVNWSNGLIWKSVDGISWSSTAFKVDGVTAPWWFKIQSAFNSTTGTYVGVLDVWANYYNKQKMYRSTDGINWTSLDATKFKGGHPLNFMIAVDMDPAACGK